MQSIINILFRQIYVSITSELKKAKKKIIINQMGSKKKSWVFFFKHKAFIWSQAEMKINKKLPSIAKEHNTQEIKWNQSKTLTAVNMNLASWCQMKDLSKFPIFRPLYLGGFVMNQDVSWKTRWQPGGYLFSYQK